MGNILDDEFVIQLDDSPPFSWIRQSPNRFMTCNLGAKLSSIRVSAIGNAFEIAEMAKDILGEAKLSAIKSFTHISDEMFCVVLYTGQLKEALRAIEMADKKGIVMSSGGMIKNVARSKHWHYFPLPKGYSTRFLFPELFGCFLSLLGEEVKIPELEDFVERNSPSEITEDNEAKRLALSLVERQATILYDSHSSGLAREFSSMFLSNSGFNFDIKDFSELDDESLGMIREKSVISFLSKRAIENEVHIGGFPYDVSTVEGYVKNVLIGEFASLYLGLLNSKEIELLDREVE